MGIEEVVIMDILIIYDRTSYIIYHGSGSVREPVGLPFIWIDVPRGKQITGVDVNIKPNVAILRIDLNQECNY